MLKRVNKEAVGPSVQVTSCLPVPCSKQRRSTVRHVNLAKSESPVRQASGHVTAGLTEVGRHSSKEGAPFPAWGPGPSKRQTAHASIALCCLAVNDKTSCFHCLLPWLPQHNDCTQNWEPDKPFSPQLLLSGCLITAAGLKNSNKARFLTQHATVEIRSHQGEKNLLKRVSLRYTL